MDKDKIQVLGLDKFSLMTTKVNFTDFHYSTTSPRFFCPSYTETIEDEKIFTAYLPEHYLRNIKVSDEALEVYQSIVNRFISRYNKDNKTNIILTVVIDSYYGELHYAFTTMEPNADELKELMTLVDKNSGLSGIYNDIDQDLDTFYHNLLIEEFPGGYDFEELEADGLTITPIKQQKFINNILEF